jgi:hypothetical protein
MYLHTMGRRGCDPQGCGYFGASRGSRLHMGADLVNPDDSSLTPDVHIQLGFNGTVVKVGWAYSDPDKSELRYVALHLFDTTYVRLFYINPTVEVGDKISPNQSLGRSLDLTKHYKKGMKNHIHFEVYSTNSNDIHSKKSFVYCNPEIVLGLLANINESPYGKDQ